jgi:hypothetical protein
VPWLRTAIRAVGALMPCPVALFSGSQEQEARRWLAESLGTIHLEERDGVIRVNLIGRLEPSAYEHVEEDIAALFSRVSPVRLLVDLRQFDGWSGLSALGEHLSILREHRRRPERVAVVGDHQWQKLLQKLLSRFTRAETRYFDSTHHEQAEVWILQDGGQAPGSGPPAAAAASGSA